jgi:hypothetical protein
LSIRACRKSTQERAVSKTPLADEARLQSELQSLRRVKAEAVDLARRTGYASDELIADRRAEAVKDAEETLRWLRERTGRP